MYKPLLIMLFLMSNFMIAAPPQFIKNCMDCHGHDGISTESDVPIIAGASAVFIEDTFYSYKDELRPAIESKYRLGDKERPPTDMKKIADELSDEQISELATYYSSIAFIPAKQKFDISKAKIGKRIHAKKCNKCHEDGGASAADDAGILAGQWTEYLQESMKHIRDGSRDTDKKMKKKIKKLSDKEWQVLLHYYASQQG